MSSWRSIRPSRSHPTSRSRSSASCRRGWRTRASHAGARQAIVTIGRRAGRRLVRVEDDGRGFDGEEVAGGQGLRNMRRRADAIEGGFQLVTAPGAAPRSK